VRAAVLRPPGAASTTWARPRPATRPAAACQCRPSHTTSHAGTPSLPRQPCHLTAQETLTSPDRSGDRLRQARHEDTKLGATQHIGAVMSVAEFSDCGILSHVMSLSTLATRTSFPPLNCSGQHQPSWAIGAPWSLPGVPEASRLREPGAAAAGGAARRPPTGASAHQPCRCPLGGRPGPPGAPPAAAAAPAPPRAGRPSAGSSSRSEPPSRDVPGAGLAAPPSLSASDSEDEEAASSPLSASSTTASSSSARLARLSDSHSAEGLRALCG